MTERIKLTEDDIRYAKESPNAQEVGLYFLIDTSIKYPQLKLKQQILDEHENNNPIYREFYEKWHHVLQENKQLKEKIVTLIDKLLERDHELKELVESRIEMRRRLEKNGL